MDISTTYMGMQLRSPLVPSASPLSEELDNIRRMEDAGAGAVVLYSLYEEQIIRERFELHHHLTHATHAFAEALTFFPEPDEFHVGPEGYLRHIERAKKAVDIPIIASMNGATEGGWIEYARFIEEAGADALELNVYYIPTDMSVSSDTVERMYLDILASVKQEVKIPVAFKLSPFFSNIAYMAKLLDLRGADALVLFNRFYQPDFDLETLEVVPHIVLSRPHTIRLPLRWIGILYGRIKADLAATSGIHTPEDVIKLVMSGASVTMLCSVLFRHGIEHISVIERGVREWMEKHEYESLRQMKGSMSQIHCENPGAFERAQYVHGLLTYPYRR
jgi:dihydroorotate dehydrogenase (fumarate)